MAFWGLGIEILAKKRAATDVSPHKSQTSEGLLMLFGENYPNYPATTTQP